MKHFFEYMERENDYQFEYEKLEMLCSERNVFGDSINVWISENFLFWEKRSNFCSFEELKTHLGFRTTKDGRVATMDVGLNKYVLFSEMMFNIIMDLCSQVEYKDIQDEIEALFNTIKATIQKVGLEVTTIEDEVRIVEKNAAAIKVAEIVPELADVIIEYNQYLLHGDLNRKKEILKRLADALEPKRKELNKYTSISKQTDDFFYLVNCMDIRHNNCDPTDKGKFNAKFSQLIPDEKESWYDKIYEQGLVLFMMLEQQKRDAEIKAFKEM